MDCFGVVHPSGVLKGGWTEVGHSLIQQFARAVQIFVSNVVEVLVGHLFPCLLGPLVDCTVPVPIVLAGCLV